MKPEDQVAFDNAWASLPGVDNGYEKSLAQLGWQLSLAHRDAQPAGVQGEAVAWRSNDELDGMRSPELADICGGETDCQPTSIGNKELRSALLQMIDAFDYRNDSPKNLQKYRDDALRNARRILAESEPAASINEQLLESAKMLLTELKCGPCKNIRQAKIENVALSAIAADEQIKEQST